MNVNGEVPECGPPWACARYGSDDHDYNACPDCKDECERQIGALAEQREDA